ncbi:MAG TPA: sulfotransferase [Steroidobacteraceae bacterium]|jgi:tetratricopeptide (TPR) repeat protein
MRPDAVAPEAVMSAIAADIRAGRHDAAIVRARSALEAGLERPLVLNLAALGLEREGRDEEAERLLRKAVRLSPRDVACRNALGLCLLKLGRPQQALEQFDRVLGLQPSVAFAHVNRGNALNALRAIDAARESYERALALDPTQPMALAALAGLAARRGSYQEVRALAEKALAAAPELTEAQVSLAAAEFGDGELGRAERRLRSVLESAGLSVPDRIHVQGLLGDVLDAACRYDEAFETYTSCNEVLLRRHAGRYASALQYARELSAWAESSCARDGRWGRPAAVGASPPSRHIFVLGFPRSGATLIDLALEGHPQVACVDGTELLLESVQEFMQRPQDLERLVAAQPATLEWFRAAYWRRIAAAGVDPQGRVVVDTCALNSLKLPLIARLFPGAKILFACRDPRDLVVSCCRQRFAMSAPTYELLTLEGAAAYYVAVTEVFIRLANLLGLEVCLVRHEDMVSAFAREMARLCEFLGIDWHPAMGDFALRSRERGEPVPSMSQLVHSLGTEGLGGWHHYRARLEPVLPLLEPWVKRFYYG